MHGRRQILEEIKTELLTLSGVTVKLSRVYPTAESEMPIFLVYSLDETIDYSRSTSNGTFRNLDVIVEIVCTDVEADVDATVDSFCVMVEDKLQESTLNGKALRSMLMSTAIRHNSESELPLGMAALTFSVQYRTVPNNAETLA